MPKSHSEALAQTWFAVLQNARSLTVLRWRSLAPLVKCGQNSLQVFCFGVLSSCAHAAIELSENSLWVQVSAGAAGILLMTAVAYGWSWSRQRHRMVLSQA